MEHFEDTSPFQGMKDFDTPIGELRVEYTGTGKEAVFYRRQGRAFVRMGSVRCHAPVKHMSCEQLYGAYIASELDDDTESA